MAEPSMVDMNQNERSYCR